MEAAAAHEEKDDYQQDKTDEVSQAISDIDAFERKLGSDGTMAAPPPARPAQPPPWRATAAKPTAAVSKPSTMKAGQEYVRNAKKAARKDDEDEGGIDDAAQATSDIDKFNARFGGDDDDD